MTGEEFTALAESMRLRTKSSATSAALRRYLVEGVSKEEAAISCLVQPRHLEEALKSVKQQMERVRILRDATLPLGL